MEKKTLIRPMKIEDIDDVLKIEQVAFEKQSRDDFIRCINRGEVYKYFVLEEDGKIIGYYGMSAISDEGELLTIALNPEKRGRGYASQMMRTCILQAGFSGSKKIFLEVNENNMIAIILYKKFGFREISRRKNYYGKDDAIIMQKDL